MTTLTPPTTAVAPAPTPRDKAIAALVTLLNDPNVEIRLSAAKVILALDCH